MIRRLALVSAILLAGVPGQGAAAGMRYTATSPSTLQQFQIPPVGTEAETEIGRSITTSGRVPGGILVLEPASGKSAGNRVELPAGLYRLAGVSANGKFFQADSPPIRLKAFGMSESWPQGGVHVSDDPTVPPEFYYLNALGMVFHSPVPSLKFKEAPPEALNGGFRRELIYSGVAKGVVTLVYREFVNDLARPAFTQTLTYDLSEGDEIGYRGARLKVLRATNMSIRYTMLKAMDAE